MRISATGIVTVGLILWYLISPAVLAPQQPQSNHTNDVQTLSEPVKDEPKTEKVIEAVITKTEPPKPLYTVGGGCEQYRKLISEHFKDVHTAMAVMQAESGCNSQTVGDTTLTFKNANGETIGMSCGLFQIRILPGRPSCEWLKDPVNNITYAGNMQHNQGWRPWSAYNNGSYRKYL